MAQRISKGRGLLLAAALIFIWGAILSGVTVFLRKNTPEDPQQQETAAEEPAPEETSQADDESWKMAGLTAPAWTEEPSPETPSPEPLPEATATAEPLPEDTPELFSDSADILASEEGEVYADDPDAEDPEETAANVTPVPAEVTPASLTPEPHAEILPKFAALQKDIPNLAGWLKVRALYQIDFAVVKKDNTFYLNHDVTGAENDSGAAFMDEYNTISPRDDNLIIYAHNKANGSMFGSLFRLGYREYVLQDPVTVFSTLYEEGMYIPVAVYEATTGGTNDFDFMTANFTGPQAKEAFIAESRRRSYLSAKAECGAEDDLLTLVTCIDGSKGGRLVVLLRRMRAQETEESVKAYY